MYEKLDKRLSELRHILEGDNEDDEDFVGDEEFESDELNSEGKPLARSEAALRAFKSWFEGSRVTDADDRPLVVYHGSNKKFDVFEGGEFGFHFGTEGASSPFGSETYKCYLRIENPFYINRDLGDWKPKAMLKELVNALGSHGSDAGGELTRSDRLAALKDTRSVQHKHKDVLKQDDDMTSQRKALYLTGASVRKLYEKHGYDGIVYKNEGEGGTSWIAFHANQIKRTDNKGFKGSSSSMKESGGSRAQEAG